MPDIMLGKRSAFLDLKNSKGLETLASLISQADVLVHGYRPGALEGLGINKQYKENLNPQLVEVCLDAYGWSGPWANRRGFDSLVQMSCGIADAAMYWANSENPTPLPVQALDHATGYLMAAAVIKGLESAITQGNYCRVRLSLARTAQLLKQYPQYECEQLDASFTPDDANKELEMTPWGAAYRLKSPIEMPHTQLQWQSPAEELGQASANWLSD